MEDFIKSFNKLIEHYDSFSKQQKKIADYIVAHYDEFIFSSISDLSRAIGSSEATIVRFAQRLGYTGFTEFKNDLVSYYSRYLTPAERMKRSLHDGEDNDFSYKNITEKEIEFIRESIYSVDEKIFQEIVNKIYEAETLFIYGDGPNRALADHMQFRLNRFRVKAGTICSSGRRLFEDLLIVGKRDFVLVFSFYKPSIDFRRLMDVLTEKKIETALITDNILPPMVHYTPRVLYAKRGRLGFFNSSLIPLAISNALILGVANKLGDQAVEALRDLEEMRENHYYNEILEVKHAQLRGY